MKIYILNLLIVLSLFACDLNKESNFGYTLQGEISGIDGTWLFLKESETNRLDSALVNNGQFIFKGVIPDSVVAREVTILFRDFHDYRTLWIENANMTLIAGDGKLSTAKITGSAVQTDNDQYSAAVLPKYKLQDSLFMVIANLRESGKTTDTAAIAALEGQQHDADKAIQKLTSEFIQQHPNSILSAHLVNGFASTWGRANTAKHFNMLTDKNKQSSAGKKVDRYLALFKDLKVGDHVADFVQANPHGQKVSVASFSGKVLLIDFWAAWCRPCRDANPALVKLYLDNKARGLEMLGVSLDTERKHWERAIEADSLLWTQVSELNGMENTAAKIYGVSAIPDNILVNRDGIIIARNLHGDELRSKINELLVQQ